MFTGVERPFLTFLHILYMPAEFLHGAVQGPCIPGFGLAARDQFRVIDSGFLWGHDVALPQKLCYHQFSQTGIHWHSDASLPPEKHMLKCIIMMGGNLTVAPRRGVPALDTCPCWLGSVGPQTQAAYSSYLDMGPRQRVPEPSGARIHPPRWQVCHLFVSFWEG